MIAPPHRPLHIVDSSGWIEYFTDSPNADEFAEVIEEPANLLVPSLSILEVFEWVLRERGEDAAFQVTAAMQQAEVIDMDVILALRWLRADLSGTASPSARRANLMVSGIRLAESRG